MYGTLHAGSCNGVLLYYGSCSLDRFVCEYDATTHALIGAAEITDTNGYCNLTSDCISAGTVSCPATPACQLPTLTADGGADAAPTDAAAAASDAAPDAPTGDL
jgi:hypothetical protein